MCYIKTAKTYGNVLTDVSKDGLLATLEFEVLFKGCERITVFIRADTSDILVALREILDVFDISCISEKNGTLIKIALSEDYKILGIAPLDGEKWYSLKDGWVKEEKMLQE